MMAKNIRKGNAFDGKDFLKADADYRPKRGRKGIAFAQLMNMGKQKKKTRDGVLDGLLDGGIAFDGKYFDETETLDLKKDLIKRKKKVTRQA